MKNNFKRNLLSIMLPLLVTLFNISMIFFPKEIIGASKEGLFLWFNNVLPALLPFLIGTNILIGLGFVNFIGTILSPVMLPLFGVSGIGGFPLVCGMTSGYPIGAKITSELRVKNEINKIEAQRLIAFTNNSGPLFIIGAVGIGMFSSLSVGYFILLIHYMGALATGLLFKYYKPTKYIKPNSNKNLFYKAFTNMKTTRAKDHRSFADILGDSVKNSMETVLIIGGYIVLFSVISKMVDIFFVIQYIDNIIRKLSGIVVSENILKGSFFGILEITSGTKILSTASFSILPIIVAAIIISFGGFSIHAQAINFICKTDINIFLYLLGKLIHAIFTGLFGLLLYPFFDFKSVEVSSVFFMENSLFINTLIFSSWNFLLSFLSIILFILFINIYFLFEKKIKYSSRTMKEPFLRKK